MANKEKTLQCKFRGASTGKNSVNIGVTIARERINPAAIDALLVGAQVTVTLDCDPNADGDTKGQQTFKTDEGITLTVNGEFRSMSSNVRQFTTTLKCHRDETDLQELDKFSFHEGKIKIKRTGNAATHSESDEGGDGDE